MQIKQNLFLNNSHENFQFSQKKPGFKGLICFVQQLLQIKSSFVLNICLPLLSSSEYQKLLHDEKSIDDQENYLFFNISKNTNKHNKITRKKNENNRPTIFFNLFD